MSEMTIGQQKMRIRRRLREKGFNEAALRTPMWLRKIDDMAKKLNGGGTPNEILEVEAFLR